MLLITICWVIYILSESSTWKNWIWFQLTEKKEAAADVLFHYSKFVITCIGSRARPSDLRLHLMKVWDKTVCYFLIRSRATCFVMEDEGIVLKTSLSTFSSHYPCFLTFHSYYIHFQEISGMPTSLNRETPHTAASPDAMGESSSSGTARLDKADSFRAL